jgi:hypothetical protein
MLHQWHKAFLPAMILSCGLNPDAMAHSTHADKIHAFKQSWTAAALRLQREIDINTPLNEATFIGTHNSYNAKTYQIPFVRYIDPNQWLSIYDQLGMGVRSIELDAHWTLNNYFSREILLCHGQSSHLGCGPFDRPFNAGLLELRNWLKENPGEVVLLYIERHLDGHEPRLAAQLDDELGEFIFKPSSIRKNNDQPKSCVSLPGSLTKADILKAGKQLLIVTKGCDGTNPPYEEQDTFQQVWNDFVFAGMGNMPDEPYSFLDSTIDDSTAYPSCSKSTAFRADPTHTTLWRIFEDRTILSNIFDPGKKLEAADMIGLMRCGINWPTMDMLEIADPRLNAAIWSWAPSYPQENHGQCALYKQGEGIQNAPCAQMVAGFACREENTHVIKAIATPGTWTSGEFLCQVSAGKSWHFVMPVNGYQMNTLKESMAGTSMQEVWLNYTNSQHSEGRWVANGRV